MRSFTGRIIDFTGLLLALGSFVTNSGCFSLIWGSFWVKLVFWESARPGRIFGPSRPGGIFGPSRPGPEKFLDRVGPGRRNFWPKSARPGEIFGPSRPGPEKFLDRVGPARRNFWPSRPGPEEFSDRVGPARSQIAEISNTGGYPFIEIEFKGL